MDLSPAVLHVRAPSWPRLLPWILGPGALALIAGGLSALAQHEAHAQLRAAGVDWVRADFPLLPHVLVMIAVGALAVAGATGLARTGLRLAAGLPLLAAAAGPMAVVAVPVRASWVSEPTGDTAGWWHLVVGAVVLAVLVTWTVLVVRRAPAVRPLLTPRASPAFLLLVLSAVAALAVVGLAPEPEATAPTGVPVAAWSVLGATVAVVLVTERRRLMATGVAALAVAAVLAFPLAYRQPSAGPAVPGWEFAGTSPVVLSTLLGVVVLATVVVGVVLRPVMLRPASPQRRPLRAPHDMPDALTT